MLAKLIVWAADREHALRRLERALGELRIEGIRTNVPLFRALLADADFRSGNMDIGMLDRKMAAGELQPVEEADEADSLADLTADLPMIAAALAHYEEANRTVGGQSGGAGRRSVWAAAGRREALRGGSWN
jgi:acetyl-CoA carboxylase biotin carboxylase subunit